MTAATLRPVPFVSAVGVADQRVRVATPLVAFCALIGPASVPGHEAAFVQRLIPALAAAPAPPPSLLSSAAPAPPRQAIARHCS